MITHPDADSSGFSPSRAWCAHCGAAIRMVGVSYYAGAHGPFCSIECSGLFKKPSCSLSLNEKVNSPECQVSKQKNWTPDGL